MHTCFCSRCNLRHFFLGATWKTQSEMSRPVFVFVAWICICSRKQKLILLQNIYTYICQYIGCRIVSVTTNTLVNELQSCHTPPRSLCSADSHLFSVSQRTRSEPGSTDLSSPTLRSSLPTDIKRSTTLPVFNRALRNLLTEALSEHLLLSALAFCSSFSHLL